MKSFLLTFTFLAAILSATFAAQDPWQEYGKGKGKGHPVTPEPAAYGAILIGGAIIFVMARKIAKRRV